MATELLQRPDLFSKRAAAQTQAVPLRGFWERRVVAGLSNLQHGQIQLDFPSGTSLQVGAAAEDDLHASVTVHDDRCLREIAVGGSLGAAEAYLRGMWSASDLVPLLRIFCRNMDELTRLDTGIAAATAYVARLLHRFARNSTRGSRRNIAAHYDLSNEFFQLFLDPTLMYSSGLFERPGQTMEQASVAKLDRICRKLELQSDDHVIEIGTGWGGWALHAARHYGCRITTTTISRNQFDLARQRVAAAGLNERIEVLFEDYRNLTGQYDKLVSIEMIEAVGHEYLPRYFRKCDQLMKPGGRMLVQAITMPDQRYAAYRKSVDFIQRYIFPGGHLPAIGAMQAATEQGTRLQLIDAVQFPESYARTLRLWREQFLAKLENVRELGFDERFIRMWYYYLCYCEAAFLERSVSVGQFVWQKNRYC